MKTKLFLPMVGMIFAAQMCQGAEKKLGKVDPDALTMMQMEAVYDQRKNNREAFITEQAVSRTNPAMKYMTLSTIPNKSAGILWIYDEKPHNQRNVILLKEINGHKFKKDHYCACGGAAEKVKDQNGNDIYEDALETGAREGGEESFGFGGVSPFDNPEALKIYMMKNGNVKRIIATEIGSSAGEYASTFEVSVNSLFPNLDKMATLKAFAAKFFENRRLELQKAETEQRAEYLSKTNPAMIDYETYATRGGFAWYQEKMKANAMVAKLKTMDSNRTITIDDIDLEEETIVLRADSMNQVKLAFAGVDHVEVPCLELGSNIEIYSWDTSKTRPNDAKYPISHEKFIKRTNIPELIEDLKKQN